MHIFVDDTNGHTWNHSADVTADDAGEIQDVFDLPTSFVPAYDVTATGDVSGIATATFTDGNVNVKTVGVASATVSYRLFNSTNCTGSSTLQTIIATSGGNGTGIPSGASATQSLQLTAERHVSGDDVPRTWCERQLHVPAILDGESGVPWWATTTRRTSR